MEQYNLEQLIAKLQIELQKERAIVLTLRKDKIHLEEKIEVYKSQENDLKTSIEKSKEKLDKIVRLKNEEYGGLIKEIFQSPVYEITDEIKLSSKKSTRSTLMWAIFGILATTLISILLNVLNSSKFNNEIGKLKTSISIHNDPNINNENIERIKSIIKECDYEKDYGNLKIENYLQEIYTNCLEPNLNRDEIVIDYKEVFIAYEELGFDFTFETISNELFEVDFRKMKYIMNKYDTLIPYDSLKNYEVFKLMKKRYLKNFYDTIPVQRREGNKAFKELNFFGMAN